MIKCAEKNSSKVWKKQLQSVEKLAKNVEKNSSKVWKTTAKTRGKSVEK